MNTDKNENVRALDLDEIELVAGAKVGEPANAPIPPHADARPSLDGSVVPAAGAEPITPLRRFLSMRI